MLTKGYLFDKCQLHAYDKGVDFS